MEDRIKNRFTPHILQEAIQRYNIQEHAIQLLDGFESYIYEFRREDGDYILRIGHSFRRNVNLIRGEVDWINYLAGGGVSVVRAIPSARGNLIEEIPDGQGEHFLATAFTKAHGFPPNYHDWTPVFNQNYGRLLGRMHALSKIYTPTSVAWQRPHWDDPIMLDVLTFLPSSQTIIIQKYKELMAYLTQLPKDRNSYGLIHQDAHTGNMFVDETGNLTLFDFDDCAMSWYIYDIAMVLFYGVMWRDDPTTFTQTFMQQFLQGYREENTLDSAWLKEIPHFLKLREIDLYAVIHRSFDVDNLDDPWDIGYMQGRKEKIESDTPYIDFDFATLREYL